jgi:Macrocin-O-methyltransferase (TylF)
MKSQGILGRFKSLFKTSEKAPPVDQSYQQEVLPVPGTYSQDGLSSIHNHEFMTDPDFVAAYQRGVLAAGIDYQWHWRVHVGLWAAYSASKLSGDFVECGVNKGFMSSSIMHYLNWDALGKTFYLLDTFNGIDERYVTTQELEGGVLEKNKKLIESGRYIQGSEAARINFSDWKNTLIIEGVIPETLTEVRAEQVAFLHIDLNCAPPEVAALSYFWDRLVVGAFVLLDDYAYHGYREQKLAVDEFAKSRGVRIVSLPTGQGLLIKTN